MQTLTLSDLEQFYGTERYYEHRLGRFNYTDGVRFLADKAACYWLLDIVASVQRMPKIKAESFIVWNLQRHPDTTRATVKADDGNGNLLYQQEIEYTDFPLDSIKLYMADGVLMLPSEY